MNHFAVIAGLLGVALLPRAAQAQIQEMRQNIFGMD